MEEKMEEKVKVTFEEIISPVEEFLKKMVMQLIKKRILGRFILKTLFCH